MVKGISRQVIVVQSPDPKLFEQAIFILSDQAVGKEGITDRELLKEANGIIHNRNKRVSLVYYGPVWACIGAFLVGAAWIICSLI